MKRCAVIGVGQFGFYHAEKYFAMSDVDLTVVDTDLERAIQVAETYGCRYLTDYKELFGVDYVSIATPDSTHYEIAKHFLQSGVAVLVEKPIAETIIQAKDLMRVANEKGVVLKVGYLEAYNSAYQIAKRMIDTTGFTYVSVNRTNGGNSYKREDIDVVNDLMAHDLYLLLELINAPIVGMMVQGYQNAENVNYQARAVIEFNGGIQAELVADRATESKRAEWNFLTPKQVIRADLLKKENDTLFDEILDFVNGGKSNAFQAVKVLELSQKVIDKSHGK